jgi:hypothetical protein
MKLGQELRNEQSYPAGHLFACRKGDNLLDILQRSVDESQCLMHYKEKCHLQSDELFRYDVCFLLVCDVSLLFCFLLFWVKIIFSGFW